MLGRIPCCYLIKENKGNLVSLYQLGLLYFRFQSKNSLKTMCNILRNIGSYLFETVKINGNK